MREPPAAISEMILVTLLTLAACAWLLLALSGSVLGLSHALHQYASLQFPMATGQITRSKVEKDLHTKKDRSKPPYAFYWAELEYQYEVHGKLYRGTRYRYERHRSDSDPTTANALIVAYPVGRNVPVFYDPDDPADALLKPGIVAHDLFLFPNAAFVAVGLIALRFMYGWWRDHVFRPDTGGIRIVSRGSQTRARLPRFSPLMLGLIAAGVLSLVATFTLDESFRHPLSLREVGYGWAMVIGLPALVFIGFRWRLASGHEDLIIDRDADTITLPRNFGRRRTITIGIPAIASVELIESGQGRNYRWHPTLIFSDPALKSARLGNWGDRQKGRAFVDWLRRRIWSPMWRD